jgi:hypothetical protein
VTLALAGTADRSLLRWTINNGGASPVRVQLADALGGGQPARVLPVDAGASYQEDWDALGQAYGWYDLTFTVHGGPRVPPPVQRPPGGRQPQPHTPRLAGRHALTGARSGVRGSGSTGAGTSR